MAQGRLRSTEGENLGRTVVQSGICGCEQDILCLRWWGQGLQWVENKLFGMTLGSPSALLSLPSCPAPAPAPGLDALPPPGHSPRTPFQGFGEGTVVSLTGGFSLPPPQGLPHQAQPFRGRKSGSVGGLSSLPLAAGDGAGCTSPASCLSPRETRRGRRASLAPLSQRPWWRPPAPPPQGLTDLVYPSAGAATTECHRLGGLQQHGFIFSQSGGWKSSIEVLAGSVSPEAAPWRVSGCLPPVSSQVCVLISY